MAPMHDPSHRTTAPGAAAGEREGSAHPRRHDRQQLALHLQRTVGNVAVARRLGPVLARFRTSKQWLKDSDISIGPFRTDRSPELKRVDKAVLDYEALALAGAPAKARKDQVVEIEKAINDWRGAKGGPLKAEKRARGPRVSALYGEVQAEKTSIDRELKREKIEGVDPGLLAGLPADASAAGLALFTRFMTRFRGSGAKYTLVTAGQKSPWDGGSGPFACGTFAKALADLALAAGLDAKSVNVTPVNFVTPLVDGDFVDQSAAGNIQVKGERKRRYFFTEHWVTRIGGDYYCPTSGKILSSRAAPEVVDSTIGQLAKVNPTTYSRGATTVTRAGTTADGGGLYDLVVG